MRDKVIVTTTINPPTKAIYKYLDKNWDLVVVGDMKTPHQMYFAVQEMCPQLTYLSPDIQKSLYPELSESIGWNCIQRRAIGFAYAYKHNYSIIASVDDDNIPLSNWGKNLLLGKRIKVPVYQSEFVDPLAMTNHPELWHRGFPLTHLSNRKYKLITKTIIPMVQADLWNGDPDVDAICRFVYKPNVKFKKIQPFSVYGLSPFNTQNTFFTRDAIKDYYLYPGIGRMDDIWGAYEFEKHHPMSVVYNNASVFQERNEHDLSIDMKNELIGYSRTLDFVKNPKNVLPDKALKFQKQYAKLLSRT